MGVPKVHNLIMVLAPPDEADPVAISLTIPEPGALRLRDSMGAVQHGVVAQPHMSLASGFQQLDSIIVNPPVPRAPVPGHSLDGADPTHMMVPIGEMEAIAAGEKTVVMNENSNLPQIIDLDPAVPGIFLTDDVVKAMARGELEFWFDDNGELLGTRAKQPEKPTFDPANPARDPALDPQTDPAVAGNEANPGV